MAGPVYRICHCQLMHSMLVFFDDIELLFELLGLKIGRHVRGDNLNVSIIKDFVWHLFVAQMRTEMCEATRAKQNPWLRTLELIASPNR